MKAFGDPAGFAQRVNDFVVWLSGVEPGVVAKLPGDRGWETRKRYLAEGIPIHAEILEELRLAGVLLGGTVQD